MSTEDTTITEGAAPPIDLKDPKLYINRELGLLEFQRRVLEEAQDESNPLLERVKFLAILGSNMDEFFMVRVAGLKKQIAAGVVNLPPDGMTPAEQLAEIRIIALQLARNRTSIFISKKSYFRFSPHWLSTRVILSPTSRI